ncbi:DnaJ domain-containing protein [Nemania sp. FL0916]|nr:DnaJ domain-containing protein [Nemania sp. FL0916]
MPANLTHYDVLNITVNASEADIKSAYRRQVLLYHPDKVKTKSEAEKAEAEAKFLQLKASLEFLTSVQRCAYDLHVMGVLRKEQRNACNKWRREKIDKDLKDSYNELMGRANRSEQRVQEARAKRKEAEQRENNTALALFRGAAITLLSSLPQVGVTYLIYKLIRLAITNVIGAIFTRQG